MNNLIQERLAGRIMNDFTYHKPTPEMLPVFQAIRDTARGLALLLNEKVPHGRELSSSLTRLEECVMHANAGIARQGQRDEQV